MTKRRQVDEVRVRRLLRDFDRDHPEGTVPLTPSQLSVTTGGKPLGRPPADDPKISIGVRLPKSILGALDVARGDRARQDVLREAVQRWLRRERRR